MVLQRAGQRRLEGAPCVSACVHVCVLARARVWQGRVCSWGTMFLGNRALQLLYSLQPGPGSGAERWVGTPEHPGREPRSRASQLRELMRPLAEPPPLWPEASNLSLCRVIIDH